MTPWPDVLRWCDGGNARYEDCFVTMFGNRLAQTTGQVMSNAEVLRAGDVLSNVATPSAIEGTTFEAGLTKIQASGWPPDPMLTVKSWRTITAAEIAATLNAGLMVGRAVALPMNAAGDDYDWTDDALARKAPGIYGHAVYAPDPLVCITWANPQGATKAWWDEYGRGVWAIDFGEAFGA